MPPLFRSIDSYWQLTTAVQGFRNWVRTSTKAPQLRSNTLQVSPVTILLPGYSPRQLQRKAPQVEEVQGAPDVQQLPKNPRTLPEVLVRRAIWAQREEPRTWTFLLEMKHLLKLRDLVRTSNSGMNFLDGGEWARHLKSCRWLSSWRLQVTESTIPYDMVKWRTGYGSSAIACESACWPEPQDHMERFWQNSIFKYLRVEPEDHYFLLTEPVCNFRTVTLRGSS